MKLLRNITNGVILIAIAILHTKFCLSSDGYGPQFNDLSSSYFFEICNGFTEFPTNEHTNFASHAAFWFFYFGLLLIPLGLLVHSIEREKKRLPLIFTISYFIIVLVGCYMIPKSGMTFFMLPHAVFMLVQSIYKKSKKIKV